MMTLPNEFFHNRKLLRKYKQGEDDRSHTNYKEIRSIRRILTIAFYVCIIFVTVLLFSTINIGGRQIDDLVPTVKLSDLFLKEGATDVQPFQGFYEQRSSFYAPEQYRLYQTATIDETYSPSLWSNRYEFRGPWLATRFMKSVITFEEKDYLMINYQPFEEVWSYNEEDKVTLIARSDKTVFYVIYEGVEPIELLLDKAADYLEGIR